MHGRGYGRARHHRMSEKLCASLDMAYCNELYLVGNYKDLVCTKVCVL